MNKRPEISPKIGFEEFIGGCFSRSTLKYSKIGKLKWGPYVARLCWDVEGLPFNQQVIWLLFEPRYMKRLERALKEIRQFMEEHDRRLVIIEDFDPNIFYLPLDIMMFCDGQGSANAMTIKVESEAEGHVAWIVGQGRGIDFEEECMIGALQAVLANFFRNKRLRKNKFMEDCIIRLEKFREAAESLDLRVSELNRF